ncbi:MAG: class I SAM-dependent methyltransferase [Deltaproteobacteria bacterium]|nr:class I SAM-dependent methyltransferase [Deltaproteobacteria bacterium]
MSATKFDDYARGYEDIVTGSVTASGESAEYFSRYKLDCMKRLGLPQGEPVLDYGCGVGGLLTLLGEHFEQVHGFDPSKESLAVAARRTPTATLHHEAAVLPAQYFSAAVLSNVLHHVPPADRVELVRRIGRSLKPGGKLVIFEHNPLNPLTQRVVRSCPFDDDAILLWPWSYQRMLSSAGLGRIRRDFIVFFPKFLAALRPLESKLGWLPLGAQVMVTATAEGKR